MSIKNFFGGAIINYGASLPPSTGVPDGALFLKTSGADAGLHIFSFVQDTAAGTLGDQSGQLWTPLTGASVSVNANTLDGLDSTAFQLTSSLLNALSGLSTNGILVKTNASTIATRAITGDSTITISPAAGDGVAGNIGVSVNQAGLSLNNIGGILSLAKGGTGTALSITQGGVIYGTTPTTLASTGAGTAGWLLRANGSGAPSWVNPASLSIGTAAQAAQLSPGANINGVLFDGTTNISITAANPQAITFNNGGAGGGSGTAYSGSAAVTVSYNTVGAPSTTGTGASGTWAINISGNAASATSATTATTAGSATTATSATSAGTLTTARNFSITGGATAAAVSFNGSSNVALNVTALDAGVLTGTVAAARLSGTYTINVTGTASGNLRLDGSNAMTGQLNLADGTIAAPGLAFAGDPNTGLYSPGTNANQIGFVTGGGQRLLLSTSSLQSDVQIDVPNPNTTAGGYVEVGFRRVPLANMTSGTLTAVTSGCAVAATGTITVDNGVFSSGDTVTIYNDTGSSISLVQGVGMTLYGDAAATGNKTIPPRGMVTICFRSSSVAKVTGEMS